MFDPPAVPFDLKVGSTLRSNDGGPQHTAGAQFADSIAVPGAAAVPVTLGPWTMFQLLERPAAARPSATRLAPTCASRPRRSLNISTVSSLFCGRRSMTRPLSLADLSIAKKIVVKRSGIREMLRSPSVLGGCFVRIVRMTDTAASEAARHWLRNGGVVSGR